VIRLEPHYQLFLRSQFRCEAEVFEFPPRHRFNTILEHLVVTRVDGQIRDNRSKESEEDDKYLFKIALPDMRWKNPTHFRYFSKNMEEIFCQKIKEYYDFVIIERISYLMRNPQKDQYGNTEIFDRQQCTTILIKEFKFDAEEGDSFDRLYKLFTRYKRRERDRRYYLKKKEEEKLDE
jgi:hypothetical protein